MAVNQVWACGGACEGRCLARFGVTTPLGFLFCFGSTRCHSILPFNWTFRFIVNAIKTRQLSPPGFYANGALH